MVMKAILIRLLRVLAIPTLVVLLVLHIAGIVIDILQWIVTGKSFTQYVCDNVLDPIFEFIRGN